MLKIVLITILSFVSVFTSYSQEFIFVDSSAHNSPIYLPQKRFAIGISSGITGIVVRDQVISNFLYKGTTVPVILGFNSFNQYSKSSFTIGFMNSPKLKTETNKGFAYKGDFGEFFPSEKDGLDFSTLKTTMSFINYTSLYLLKKTERNKVRTYLGFDIDSYNFKKKFLQFEYINEMTERVTSVAFVANFERNFSAKHSLEYTFSLPVLAYAKRSLYSAEAEKKTTAETKFSSFNKVFGFNSQFAYRFQVSPSISLRAMYAFRYMQVSFPFKEQWAYNQATVGVYFHF